MLRTIMVLLVGLVSMLVLGVVATITSAIIPRSHMTLRLGRIWSRLILWVAGVRVRYEGLEHTRGDDPRVFMANHQSFVDTWALIPVLPLPTMFVAKKSLYGVPGLGWAMAASGFVSIDRTDRASAIRSLEQAAARVRDGRPIVLFPEGTRTRDGSLGSFKKGPFYLALEAAVPVVAVAISGSWERIPPGKLQVRPGTVEVRFVPPIDPSPFRPDDVEGLIHHVRTAIAEHIVTAGPR